MSVQLDPDQPTRRREPEDRDAVAAMARSHRLDERITGLIRGFDAPFFQAGLAGYSDAAMRLVARRHGCPYAVTEALLDRTLINGGKGRVREDPDLLAEECGTGDPQQNKAAGLDDHPIAGQIIGTEPDEMARGAALLVGMKYDAIDVNLACPVKKIKRRNRGGHFLSEPDDAIAVLEAVRQAVPSAMPTTVKLRRAYDDTPAMALNFERVFNAAYELGYAWTTVHCRTVKQKYNGPGRWSFLVDLVARHPDRIIFGSGDIWIVDDIFRMLDQCGVQAVGVARGCIGNPWIFRQARQLMAGISATDPTLDEQRQALLEHFELAVKLHGERHGSKMMRKFGIKFSAHHPQADSVKNEFIRCASIADWRAVINQRYRTHEAAASSCDRVA